MLNVSPVGSGWLNGASRLQYPVIEQQGSITATSADGDKAARPAVCRYHAEVQIAFSCGIVRAMIAFIAHRWNGIRLAALSAHTCGMHIAAMAAPHYPDKRRQIMALVGIFVGTVYGNALLAAEEAQSVLQHAGHQVDLIEELSLTTWQKYQDNVVLIITSTTGHGDFPDAIASLVDIIKTQADPLSNMRYGVIALGDSSYDHFCAAGKKIWQLLGERGAVPVGEWLLVDAEENPEAESITSPWVAHWAERL